MMVKIWFRLVTGRGLEMHWLFYWEAEESEKKFCVALDDALHGLHGVMVGWSQ